MTGLRTPVTDVYGERESVPALSARSYEAIQVASQVLAAGGLLAVDMPPGTQAVEISVENAGAAAARVRFIARSEDSDPADDAAAAAVGLPRRIPAGTQLVETRAVIEGDRFVVAAEQAVTVTVHAHRGPA